VYTGGLEGFHALVFAVLGERLESLRLALFAVALFALVPALWLIAARFLGPPGAAVTVLVAVAWSLPNYFAAVPSWYNLVLAVLGVLALLRYLDTGRRRWIVAAGLCGGLSFLVKSSGLGFLGAALLFLLHDEQSTQATPEDAGELDVRRGAFTLLLLATLLAFGGVATRAEGLLGRAELYHFGLPLAALALALLAREWKTPSLPLAARARRLATRALPLVLGAALALLPFLALYVSAGAVPDLVRGLFVLPARRFEHAALPPPPIHEALYALPLLLLLAWFPARRQRVTIAIVGVMLAAVLVAGERQPVYRAVWTAVQGLPVLLVVLGAWLHANAPLGRDRVEAGAVFLLLGVTTFATLVQLPFAVPVYFCYVAPLVALTGAALAARCERPARPLLGAVALFLLAFAALRLHPGTLSDLGWGFWRAREPRPLALERAGLRVDPDDAEVYEDVVRWIEARGGDFIYAAPDCHELYFLADRQNPTRTLYDFFDEREGRTARILDALAARAVAAVVVNLEPEFSSPMDRELYEALCARYPAAVRFGRFEARSAE